LKEDEKIIEEEKPLVEQSTEHTNKSARGSFEAAISTNDVQRLVALEGSVEASTSSNERVSEEDGLSPRKTPADTASPQQGSGKKAKKKKRPLSFLKKKKQK